MVFKSGYAKIVKVSPKVAKRARNMRRYRSRRGRGGLTKLIKKVSLSNSEPKIASQLFSSLANPGHLTLGHNATFYQGNLLKSSQGETANPGTNVFDNRIGNEIYAKGLKLRMQIINAPTQSNVTYKVFVFRYRTGETLQDTMFWSGPSGAGATQNRMIDFVDTREITVLKTLMINTSSKSANMNQSYLYSNSEHPYILGSAGDGSKPKMHSTYRDIWIPLNRKIRYDDNNAPTPKFTDIGLAVVAYDVNNTAQGTALGYLDFTSRLYFRDP
jgi:hypothetical protein